MEWHDLLSDAYGRIPDFMESLLSGLSQDDLDWQPRHDSNSIGWLCWHLTRQEDAQVADLMGEEQLWIKDGWHSKFKRGPEAGDTGFGNTPEQVAEFKSPPGSVLLEYQRVVAQRTKEFLTTLSDSDLDRELDEPWFQPKPTVGVRLVSIMEDGILHAGQAAYVRGLLQGKGWQKY